MARRPTSTLPRRPPSGTSRPFQAAAAPRLTALASRTGYALNLGDGHHHNLYNRDPVRADPSAAVSDQRFTYCQSVSERGRPLSLRGLGTSARSRLFGRAWVEFRDPDDDVGATGAAWFRGSAVTPRDEALEYAIFSLRDGDSLDTWSFEALFGQSVEDCFPQALAAWAELGLGERRGDRLTLRAADRTARTEALLWLVSGPRLEWELARHAGLPITEAELRGRLADRLGPAPRRPLPGRWTRTGLGPARLHLAGTTGAVVLRLAPSIQPGAPTGQPRLVLEGAPPPSRAARASLKGASRALVDHLSPR